MCYSWSSVSVLKSLLDMQNLSFHPRLFEVGFEYFKNKQGLLMHIKFRKTLFHSISEKKHDLMPLHFSGQLTYLHAQPEFSNNQYIIPHWPH